jgi:hypothetical protein
MSKKIENFIKKETEKMKSPIPSLNMKMPSDNRKDVDTKYHSFQKYC